MPIEKTPVRTVQVDYRCDACGEGHYRPTGQLLRWTSYPYVHECDRCSNRQKFDCTYPHIAHEPVREPECTDTDFDNGHHDGSSGALDEQINPLSTVFQKEAECSRAIRAEHKARIDKISDSYARLFPGKRT